MNKSELEQLIKERGLVNVLCPLEKAYAKLVPESIRMAREIQKEQRYSFAYDSFIVGDGIVYAIEDKKAVLYVTDTQLNPIFKKANFTDALRQIRDNGHYKVEPNDISMIINAANNNVGAKRYLLSDLGLSVDLENDESGVGFFEIDTANYKNQLIGFQRSFVEQIYGGGKQLARVMNNMSEVNRVPKANIYALTPKNVQVLAKAGPVARIGVLVFSGYESTFYAGEKKIDRRFPIGKSEFIVRGVPLEAPGTPPDYKNAFETLLDDPEETRKHMTASQAAGIMELANNFFQRSNR